MATFTVKHDGFGGKLVSGVEFVDEGNKIEICKKIYKNVGNLRLKGDTGVGKTTMVYAIAEMMKSPLFEVVLTRDTSRWDLLATDILTEGKTAIREGIILLWLKAPKGTLYLDGFNYSEPNIVSLVECLSDFRGNIWIPELKKEFKRSKEHYLCISYNPSEKAGYSGTFIENIATIRRFEGITVNYLSIMRETKLMQRLSGLGYEWCRKMVELADKTRSLYKNGNLRMPLTTGNLLNYAKLKKDGLSDNEIIEVASSLFAETEQETFKDLFNEVENIALSNLQP